MGSTSAIESLAFCTAPIVMQHSMARGGGWCSSSSGGSISIRNLPSAQVHATPSGRQSGKSAAERARHAASMARASAAGVRNFHEVVSDKALETFRLLDANDTGALDVAELRRVLLKLEAAGLSEGLLDAIEFGADCRTINATQWVDHFNGLARTCGRTTANDYLQRLVAIKVLRDASMDARKLSSSPVKEAPADTEAAGGEADTPLEAQLLESLVSNFTSVATLFSTWDGDGNGAISRMEFGKAIEALSLAAPAEEIDRCFAIFDTDGSGTISSRELQQHLAAKNIQLAVDDVLRLDLDGDPPGERLEAEGNDGRARARAAVPHNLSS
jgi:Ca2+-binding EF-hand superfamily protein